MEGLKELAEVAKSQGPIIAGWLLLLAAVAWIAGHGARAAIKNVSSILDMNEKLRSQLAEQLTKANDGRDEADRTNAKLRADLTESNRRMADLEGRLEFAERRATRLESELQAMTAENRRLRSMSSGN